jgi:hypothetical protein
MLLNTGFAVAVITGLLGLPRWPALVGLGGAGLFYFFLLAIS